MWLALSPSDCILCYPRPPLLGFILVSKTPLLPAGVCERFAFQAAQFVGLFSVLGWEDMESCKRPREDDVLQEDDEQGACLKKLCQGLGIEEEEGMINGILGSEDEEPLGSQCVMDQVQEELLSGVMKSLEEEIGFSSAASSPARHDGFSFIDDVSVVELSDDCSTSEASDPPARHSSLDFIYLLEASDDELGISFSPGPALSEVEVSCSAVPFDSSSDEDKGENILDFLDGEVLPLATDSLNNEFELPGDSSSQDWLRRAVATLDMVMDPALVGPSVLGMDPSPVLVEAAGI